MKLTLTCARCSHVWVLDHWTPDATRCPLCGAGELTRGAHLTEVTDAARSKRATAAAVRRRQAVGR